MQLLVDWGKVLAGANPLHQVIVAALFFDHGPRLLGQHADFLMAFLRYNITKV